MSKDFTRIAKAIEYIEANGKQQPSLDEVSAHLHLSPHHFHRLFTRYCGVTPKQFLQVLTVNQAKEILQARKSNLETALAAGLSGSSRLHDHFVSIEAVTPGEFKSGGLALTFFWGEGDSPFGSAQIVWTAKGIHRLAFIDNKDNEAALKDLIRDWPAANFVESKAEAKKMLAAIFTPEAESQKVKLWVRGTNFQVSVWRALLSVQKGELASYQELASLIGQPKASRAVGSAIGKNPIAYLIPCHRVIQSSGVLGAYRWQPVRKKIILSCEALENR